MKAFPQAIKESVFDHGMDLRDYFAASIMVHLNWTKNENGNKQYDEKDAHRCYEIADVMMKAREVK